MNCVPVNITQFVFFVFCFFVVVVDVVVVLLTKNILIKQHHGKLAE